MNIRLSVWDPGTARGCDVEVTAEPDTPVGSVLATLPVDVGNRPCYAEGTWLDPRTPLAHSPLLQGATICVGQPGPALAGRPSGTVGAMRVIGGPDTGLYFWLEPGIRHIGRDQSASVCLKDNAVSRAHAQLEVTTSGQISVVDLKSSHGTRIDGVQVTEPVLLLPENVLQVGYDRLAWVPVDPNGLRTGRSRDGRLEFDRAFAPMPAVQRTQIDLPQAESDHGGAGMVFSQIASALAPVAMGVMMALTFRQPWMLLIALLAPVGYMLPMVFERKQRRKREREFNHKKAIAQEKLRAHVAREESLLRALAPDELHVTLAAARQSSGLWPRNGDSPNGLVLRVGTTDAQPSVDLQGDPWEGFQQPKLRDIPATVDLRKTGVLGVVGPEASTNALLRWLLIQLATLRDPDELRLMFISAGDGQELSWASWLPHLDAGEATPCWIGNTQETRAARVEELQQQVKQRLKAKKEASAGRFTDEIVVILDGALDLRQMPGMKEILREGPSVGVYLICVDHSSMGECHGIAEFQGKELRLTRSRDDHPAPVRPEGISRSIAARLARCLAPMRDRLTLSRREQSIPSRTRFLDLVGMTAPTAGEVHRLWAAKPGPTTEVPLGADSDGVVTVDLHEQGPHAMLGGATGAGKSILLQTLVTSLLLHNRPDELNLVLVDFKGGGAFLPFENCPHVVGLIRSTGDTAADVFDEAAADRVLASVRTEVNRRESLLAPYGGEIDHYWKAGRAAQEPLPRLVMIFDEFARVLEVSPDFLKELVNVSAKGRSLGMHLLLSTQSLQGKLSAELKNNISLRISLRQNERAESTEVLEVPDAAGIPGRLRGRGMILCTKDDNPTPHVMQSGYLGDPPPTGQAVPARVRMTPWQSLGLARPEEQADHGGVATDQDLTIDAIIEAAHGLGTPPPYRPVLPPLPAELARDELDRRSTEPIPPTVIPYGLADAPVAQAQPAAVLDLAASERLLCAGGPQSGRTTFARTLITGLADRFRADRTHLYVIEHQPAGLADYANLPHCGGVFSPAEPDRIRRFVNWLDNEVQRRKAARFAPAGEPDPYLVVIIDGWEHFEDRSDPMWEETSLLATMRGIIAAAAPLGVHIVAVGGQSMMSGRLPDLYSQRLLLPFPQEDTRRLFLQSGTVPPPVLPGRAIEAASRCQVQVCTPGTSRRAAIAPPGDAEETRAFRTGDIQALLPGQARIIPPPGSRTGSQSIIMPAHDHPSGRGRLPRPFPSMPVRVRYHELTPAEAALSLGWVPVGVGGPDVTTVGVDFFDAGPQSMFVSGPAGSGRSTAAAAVAYGMRRAGIGVLAIAPPRSSMPAMLPDDAGVRVITGLALKDADLRDAAEAFGDGRYAVIIDDCEQITVLAEGEEWEQKPTLFNDVVSPESFGRRALVLCGDIGQIMFGQRPSLRSVVDEVLSTGTRVLLTPATGSTGRDHGINLEADQLFSGPPGRGYMTAGRGVDLVQFAVP